MGSTPTFLELPGSSLEGADVLIARAALEGTVSYGKGTAAAPDAILRASLHLESFDEELEFEHEGSLRYHVLPRLEAEAGEPPESYLPRLTRLVRERLERRGDRPLPLLLGLGGEHSVTAALLEALLSGPEVPPPQRWTVVQIDAHADLRESYHGSRLNHACAMRRVLDLGVGRLVAVGIRSAEAAEFRLAREDPRIETWYAHRIETPGGFDALLAALRAVEGPLYLTVDVDGLEVHLAPGTGTPQPGGLSWARTMAVLRALLRQGGGELMGADICETVPQPHGQVNETVAARLAFKIAGYRFAPPSA